MNLDAIVLAAGQSSRMGREKALVAVDGRPLIAHHVERYGRVCRRLIVAVRPDLSFTIRSLVGGAVEIVSVETESPAESLAHAVKRVARDGAVLVTPVDVLPCRMDTLAQLEAALGATGVLAATPSHRGRGGHPVLMRGALLESYRLPSAGRPLPLRDTLHRAGAGRVRVEVDDPQVLGDFDTPADLLDAS